VRIPTSFALAYLPQHALGLEWERLAGERLRNKICKPAGWLFTDRVKTQESALAKLQLSPVPALSAMHDLYAATVVVPTKAEVQQAIDAIEADMPGVEPVPRKRPKASEFLYDDKHILVRMGEHAAGLAPALATRPFEVQVKTGLQFAWWRATHDVLYKGAGSNYQLDRVGGQIRAALELIDAQLANLRGAAQLQVEGDDEVDPRYAQVTGWLERWPEPLRPEDRKTFVSSVERLVSAARVDLDGIEEILGTDAGKLLTSATEVTPFQAVLGATVASQGPEVVDRISGTRYVLITSELEAACPQVAEVKETRRATLD
jgi:ppGpp synthetase/RelA/SpoT-type nucleotidyltranferase